MENYKVVNFEETRVRKGLIKNDIPVMIIMMTLVTLVSDSLKTIKCIILMISHVTL